MDPPVGTVLAIALRTTVRGPMREVASARALVGGGLEGDVRASPNRGITFLASGHWRTVTHQLHTDLPWHTRRANILVDAPSLGHLIGRKIRVGDVEVEIVGETKPCELMDALHLGLKDALVPDCRAGVHGRVLCGGEIQVGHAVMLGA